MCPHGQLEPSESRGHVPPPSDQSVTGVVPTTNLIDRGGGPPVANLAANRNPPKSGQGVPRNGHSHFQEHCSHFIIIYFIQASARRGGTGTPACPPTHCLNEEHWLTGDARAPVCTVYALPLRAQ